MATNILDNIEAIKKLDSRNMLGSLERLARQIEETLACARGIKAPAAYARVENIIVCGMGGSALGAHIIKSLYQDVLKIPLEIINGYHLPAYVNRRTLVLLSSYSGTTEEVIGAAQEARQRKAPIAVIASGGALAEFAGKNKVPALIYTSKNNPCGSPRMGLGYSIFGQMVLLAKIGLLRLSDEDVKKAIGAVEKYNFLFGAAALEKDNCSKQLARKLGERSAWYVGAEHLSGSAHAAANQMNENAKRFAGYFLIPELNHHLMEGMLWPKSNPRELFFVLLESALYDERVRQRFAVTKKILAKNKIKHLSYVCQGRSRLEQVWEVLVLLSYASFYVAMLEGIDPTAIPFVDYFKEELKK